ncbi:MAG: hypothetical protein IJ198_02900 [Lachnospiraceae bacterium]|nr:hypothetical protein [Lachnospiraceae bacterium]
MVIECIGLPGSGKTYLMELVGKELGRREVDYVNVSAGLMNRFSWKLMRKIARALIYLSADARWLRGRLRQILAEEGTLRSSTGIYKDEEYTIRSAALFSFLYHRMVRSHKLYLFDEGLVHTLVKFCADFRLSDETFRKMVTASERGVRSARIVVLNEISEEDCLSSIKARDRHICEFDELEEEPLAALLSEYERLNNAYKENFRVLEVRREEENRRKLSRIFGRIRRVLTSAGEKEAR